MTQFLFTRIFAFNLSALQLLPKELPYSFLQMRSIPFCTVWWYHNLFNPCLLMNIQGFFSNLLLLPKKKKIAAESKLGQMACHMYVSPQDIFFKMKFLTYFFISQNCPSSCSIDFHPSRSIGCKSLFQQSSLRLT